MRIGLNERLEQVEQLPSLATIAVTAAFLTCLRGDHVEPRRKFIEDNALDVKNLDV